MAKTSSNNERDIRLSQYPITFVEIIFAVVIGASILQFRELLFPPTLASPNFWALIVAYFTAITSWFGWHQSTIKYPYTNSGMGRVRAILDALIVVAYVALLFFASKIEKFLPWYIWGFVIVFLLYYVVGRLRRVEHAEQQASRSLLIVLHGIAMLAIAVIYTILSIMMGHLPTEIIWVFALAPFAPVTSFRWFREWHELSWFGRSKSRITIAVDMDGVLVEQVVPVLEKLKQDKGIALCKCDITDWEYPIGDSNIKIEIETAERDRDFVLQMPPIKDAAKSLQTLSQRFEIVIATSREACTNSWSRDWLELHKITYKRLINTRSHGKTLSSVNLLIDDYIGNIQEFITNGPSGRQAILFAQPWNQDIGSITELIASGRVKVAHSWQTVLALLGCQPQRAEQSED